jgi:hypothetical protein
MAFSPVFGVQTVSLRRSFAYVTSLDATQKYVNSTDIFLGLTLCLKAGVLRRYAQLGKETE